MVAGILPSRVETCATPASFVVWPKRRDDFRFASEPKAPQRCLRAGQRAYGDKYAQKNAFRSRDQRSGGHDVHFQRIRSHRMPGQYLLAHA